VGPKTLTQAISGMGVFRGLMSFLSPSHQCQSTEGDRKH